MFSEFDPNMEKRISDKKCRSKISPNINIKSNSVFPVHDVYAVKFLSRLRLNFSHLNELKIGHGFKDQTMCDGGSVIERILHFLKRYQQNQTIRLELFTSIYNIDPIACIPGPHLCRGAGLSLQPNFLKRGA